MMHCTMALMRKSGKGIITVGTENKSVVAWGWGYFLG